MVTNLVNKYGLVPKCVYQESHHSSNSRELNAILKKKFREYEQEIIKKIKNYSKQTIISTGGGLVTVPENWGILHQGIVIWLDLDLKRSIKPFLSFCIHP